VPGYSRLFRRGATYYFRVGVPTALRKAIGKTEIIKSLRTTDFAEAKRFVAIESAHVDARFACEWNKLNPVSRSKTTLASLSEAEIHRLAVEWFIDLEKLSEDWWAMSGSSLERDEISEMVSDLRTDEVVFSGGNDHYRGDDGSGDLDSFLAERGIDVPEKSLSYQKLREAFRRAVDRLGGQSFVAHDPQWRDFFAHSTPPKPVQKSLKLGEFLAGFLKFIKENRSETTFTTYQTPVRIMADVLGNETQLAAITKNDIERLCEALKNRPKNAQQRYPGLTTQEAIVKAENMADTKKLGEKALENYFRNILAVFNYAVDEKFIGQNPASFRTLREQFRCKKKAKKAKFTNDELNAIFHAPLFTGCIDDERCYAKPGTNTPRRGRFWVPLLALFQGVRCNEACQLYTEDVKEIDNIPYLAIRTDLDEDEITDKRLKNKSSIRNVPIHPTLIQIGFLDFVASRRFDAKSPRLFKELNAGKTGRYSNPFSKWFGGFLASTFEKKPKATFHSFRHHFRDALRDARISDENAEALGGWVGEDEEHRHYGDGPNLRMLLEDLSKVAYPELDLRCLYPREKGKVI